MELFTRLPDELKGHMLSSYALWNASPAQVELFKTLPPEIQGFVLARKYPRELEEDTARAASLTAGSAYTNYA